MRVRDLLLFSSLSSVVFAGGFESPGVGARALGMGGAFVGVADDWTATYWNPAGLAQLDGSGIGLAVNVINTRVLDGDSMANPLPPFSQTNIERGDTFLNLGGEPQQFNVTTSKMHVPIPAMGGYHRWGPWRGALSVHMPLGFSSEIRDDSVPGLSARFKSQGIILMSGATLARELCPGVLAGVGLHALTGHIERHATKNGPGYVQQADTDVSGAAPEGIVGLLIRLTPVLSLGLVYRTPATLRFSGDAAFSDSRFPLAAPGGTLANENSRVHRDVANPATYGAGLSFTGIRRWIFAADWQGTDWRSMREKTSFDQPGLILQSVDFDPHWKFTNRFRAGAEFRWNTQWAFRGGFFTDPQALPDEAQSITNLVDVTRRFLTTGFSWAGRSWDLSAAYLYSYGRRTLSGVDFSQEGHSFLLDAVYRFR